jgi:ribosomal protein S18 acetylase RimI-like enzyme
MTAAATVELRPFDLARDFPAVVDLICEVDTHDDMDWFPTSVTLAVEWAPSPTFDPARDAIVVEVDGRLLAAGVVQWRERSGKIIHNVEIWVRPEARRNALGTRVLAWLEARARASVDEGSGGPRDLPHFLGGGADDANDASVAFARGSGYAPVRYGFEMHRPLDLPIPEAALPDGLEIRPVREEHHRAIWEADIEAFLDHWEPSVRQEADYQRFFGHPDRDTSLWMVAWDGDEVAGSVLNGIYPDENAKIGLAIGWLDHVSVRRPWRGRGLASALIVRSLTILRDRGMTVASLGVDGQNPTGALGLYERYGFRPRRRWTNFRRAL